MGNLETKEGLCPTGSLPGAKWSKYFPLFHFPFLNFCLLHPFLFHTFLPLSSCFVPFGTWQVHPSLVTSVPILLPFTSAIALMPRPPGHWLLHPQWFRFPFQLRLGSLASWPGTALQWWLRTSSAGSSGQCSTLNRGEMSPMKTLQLCFSETVVLGVLGSPLLTCFSLQSLPWYC